MGITQGWKTHQQLVSAQLQTRLCRPTCWSFYCYVKAALWGFLRCHFDCSCSNCVYLETLVVSQHATSWSLFSCSCEAVPIQSSRPAEYAPVSLCSFYPVWIHTHSWSSINDRLCTSKYGFLSMHFRSSQDCACILRTENQPTCVFFFSMTLFSVFPPSP